MRLSSVLCRSLGTWSLIRLTSRLASSVAKQQMKELCEAKACALIKAIQPHITKDMSVADLIRPIMEAEQAIFTQKQEASVRHRLRREEHPPLKVYPRELGKRGNGSILHMHMM